MSHYFISCGGTGGHLAPGIALAEGLLARGHTATLLISQKKIDARLSEKYPRLLFLRMPGSGFAWSPVQLARCCLSQFQAFRFCCALIRTERPDAIVGFGGFTSAPVVFAGRLARLPIVLHESNRVPGRAIRTLGRFAARVYLPEGIRIGRVPAAITRHAGMPVRQEIAPLPAEAARAALGFNPSQKLLVVFGGSQGASALNDWARAARADLAAEGIQLCCVTGPGKGEVEAGESLSRNGAMVRFQFLPFSDRVAELLSAADLVVARAGAGTIAELIRCAAPAILVPFPHAADDHQRANAAHFAHEGGGLVVEQAALPNLLVTAVSLISNDARLQEIRGALRRMSQGNPLELMIGDLEQLALAHSASHPSPRLT